MDLRPIAIVVEEVLDQTKCVSGKEEKMTGQEEKEVLLTLAVVPGREQGGKTMVKVKVSGKVCRQEREEVPQPMSEVLGRD
jgi:hypothetical protein